MSKPDLHRYAELNLVPELDAAIARGMDLNQKEGFGDTPLQCAIAEKSEEAAMYLVERGADATAQARDGKTALHYAVEYKLPSLVEEILKRAPSTVAISDIHGNQPLVSVRRNT